MARKILLRLGVTSIFCIFFIPLNFSTLPVPATLLSRNSAGSVAAGAGPRDCGSSAMVSKCGGRVCFLTYLDFSEQF